MFGITKVFADEIETAANTLASDAAASEQAAATMASLGPIIMMVALFAIMYFVMIRPQRKKEKETQAMIKALAVGDKIVTIGGICGKVVKIKDDYIFIESGNIGTQTEKSVIKMERQAVRSVEKKADTKVVESIPDETDADK